MPDWLEDVCVVLVAGPVPTVYEESEWVELAEEELFRRLEAVEVELEFAARLLADRDGADSELSMAVKVWLRSSLLACAA